MTWNKVVPSSEYVLAHRSGERNEKVRLLVGTHAAELNAADARSLGEYLIAKADEIKAEALTSVAMVAA